MGEAEREEDPDLPFNLTRQLDALKRDLSPGSDAILGETFAAHINALRPEELGDRILRGDEGVEAEDVAEFLAFAKQSLSARLYLVDEALRRLLAMS